MALRHQHEPGRGDGQHQHRTGQRQQPRHQAPALAQHQPGQHDEPGQHEADQALGQQAQPGQAPGQQQVPPRGQAGFQPQRGIGQRQRTGGDAAGHQHVEVGELPAHVPQRLHQQHHQRGDGRPPALPAAGEEEQRHRSQRGAQHRGRARRPGARAQQRHGARSHPIEQRRLVEERHAVERGREPVARAHHFPGHAHVAALVRQHQRPAPCGGHQPCEGEHRHQGHLGAGAAHAGRGQRFVGSGHRGSPSRPRPRRRLTTYSGRALTSSYTRPTYSPTTPSDTSWMPANSIRLTTMVVQPLTRWP